MVVSIGFRAMTDVVRAERDHIHLASFFIDCTERIVIRDP